MMLKRTRRLTIVSYTKSQLRINVKTLMGKQLNKTIKRRRRLAYLKRRDAAIKAKHKPAAA